MIINNVNVYINGQSGNVVVTNGNPIISWQYQDDVINNNGVVLPAQQESFI
jgi:hypothetical protein